MPAEPTPFILSAHAGNPHTVYDDFAVPRPHEGDIEAVRGQRPALLPKIRHVVGRMDRRHMDDAVMRSSRHTKLSRGHRSGRIRNGSAFPTAPLGALAGRGRPPTGPRSRLAPDLLEHRPERPRSAALGRHLLLGLIDESQHRGQPRYQCLQHRHRNQLLLCAIDLRMKNLHAEREARKRPGSAL